VTPLVSAAWLLKVNTCSISPGRVGTGARDPVSAVLLLTFSWGPSMVSSRRAILSCRITLLTHAGESSRATRPEVRDPTSLEATCTARPLQGQGGGGKFE
jgi:hypothetical protein